MLVSDAVFWFQELYTKKLVLLKLKRSVMAHFHADEKNHIYSGDTTSWPC